MPIVSCSFSPNLPSVTHLSGFSSAERRVSCRSASASGLGLTIKAHTAYSFAHPPGIPAHSHPQIAEPGA